MVHNRLMIGATCFNGHLITSNDQLYFDKKGMPFCRRCRSEKDRKRNQPKRERPAKPAVHLPQLKFMEGKE